MIKLESLRFEEDMAKVRDEVARLKSRRWREVGSRDVNLRFALIFGLISGATLWLLGWPLLCCSASWGRVLCIMSALRSPAAAAAAATATASAPAAAASVGSLVIRGTIATAGEGEEHVIRISKVRHVCGVVVLLVRVRM
jgi:hypothetical protein